MPFVGQGTARNGMAGTFPNPVARPSRERSACELCEHDSCKVISRAARPPAAPPADSSTRLHLPRPSPSRPNPAPGAQRWGCRLCLEADVIQTPYSAVFSRGPRGPFSSSSWAWWAGKMPPYPPHSPNTHTFFTPLLPRRIKKKKRQPRSSYETGWWGRYAHAEGAHPRAWTARH